MDVKSKIATHRNVEFPVKGSINVFSNLHHIGMLNNAGHMATAILIHFPYVIVNI